MPARPTDTQMSIICLAMMKSLFALQHRCDQDEIPDICRCHNIGQETFK